MPGMLGLLCGRRSVQLRYRYPLAPILVPFNRTKFWGKVTGELAVTRWAGPLIPGSCPSGNNQ